MKTGGALVAVMFFLVAVVSSLPVQAGFDRISVKQFKVSTEQRWLKLRLQDAFFSRVRLGILGAPAVVPAVTVSFQMTNQISAPQDAAYALLPDREGHLVKTKLTQTEFEGTWGLTHLPAEITVKLLNLAGADAGDFKITIDAIAGTVAATSECDQVKLRFLEASFRPKRSLFFACNSHGVPLTLYYAGARSISWQPEDALDRELANHIVELHGPEAYYSLDVELAADTSEHFDLVYRQNLPKRRMPRNHEWVLELGFYQSELTAVKLPSPLRLEAETSRQNQSGINGRFGYLFHARPEVYELSANLFSQLLPLSREPGGVTNWRWGLDGMASWWLPFERGRWSTAMGLGVRYENLARAGADGLTDLFGPTFEWKLAYSRESKSDRFTYTMDYSPEQPLGRAYHANQYCWSHAWGWQTFLGGDRSRLLQRSWGLKFQYDRLNVGDDTQGFAQNTFGVSTFLGF